MGRFAYRSWVEVKGDAGVPFTHGDLADRLREVMDLSEEQRDELRRLAMARVAERYSWEAVTDRYEELLLSLAPRRRL